MLTTALTSDQRKQLHAYIDGFELHHISIGNGTDRRLVVSRFKPFVVVTAAQAKDVVGSLVLKDMGAGRDPLRGMVVGYLEAETQWQLQYDGEDECVDLDLLNVRLRRRAVADHGPAGLDGDGIPAAGGMQDPELQSELLDGD